MQTLGASSPDGSSGILVVRAAPNPERLHRPAHSCVLWLWFIKIQNWSLLFYHHEKRRDAIQLERSGTECQSREQHVQGNRGTLWKGRTGKSTSVSESSGKQQRHRWEWTRRATGEQEGWELLIERRWWWKFCESKTLCRKRVQSEKKEETGTSLPGEEATQAVHVLPSWRVRALSGDTRVYLHGTALYTYT